MPNDDDISGINNDSAKHKIHIFFSWLSTFLILLNGTHEQQEEAWKTSWLHDFMTLVIDVIELLFILFIHHRVSVCIKLCKKGREKFHFNLEDENVRIFLCYKKTPPTWLRSHYLVFLFALHYNTLLADKLSARRSRQGGFLTWI